MPDSSVKKFPSVNPINNVFKFSTGFNVSVVPPSSSQPFNGAAT